MKELRFKKAHNINQLHEELEGSVPELRPRVEGSERVAVMHVQSSGDEIILSVPDEVDEAKVKAVVGAHAPKARQPPPDSDSLISAVEGAKTLQELKAAVAAALRARR